MKKSIIQSTLAFGLVLLAAAVWLLSSGNNDPAIIEAQDSPEIVSDVSENGQTQMSAGRRKPGAKIVQSEKYSKSTEGLKLEDSPVPGGGQYVNVKGRFKVPRADSNQVKSAKTDSARN